MVWIAMEKTMVYFDSIIKARATAVKMIETNPNKYRNGGVMIFATKNGTPKGIVSYYGGGHFKYSYEDPKYGMVRQAIYKNGKLMK